MNNNEYLKGFKAQLFPTVEQALFIEKCIYINRLTYNWAIEFTDKLLEEQPFIVKSGFTKYTALISQEFTQMRNSNEIISSVPWKTAFGGVKRCMKAFKMHFMLPRQFNHPRFKTEKNYLPDSFDTRNSRFHINYNAVKIEGLDSMILMKWYSEFKYSDKGFHDITISKDNFDQYWVSYSRVYEKDPEAYFESIPPLERAIGIDLNKHARIATSIPGLVWYEPNSIENNRIQINRLQAELSNVQNKTSNNYFKKQELLKKHYKKIHDINENLAQEATTTIVRMRPMAIVMEDLDVMEMRSKHYIADDIAFCNFNRIKQIMEYKCDWYGIPFIVAPREFKSTMICSCCGAINNPWDSRVYKCKNCGSVIDRDLNAAINLEKYYYLTYCENLQYV